MRAGVLPHPGLISSPNYLDKCFLFEALSTYHQNLILGGKSLKLNLNTITDHSGARDGVEVDEVEPQ